MTERESERERDFDQTWFCFWVCSYDYMLYVHVQCWFLLFTSLFLSLQTLLVFGKITTSLSPRRVNHQCMDERLWDSHVEVPDSMSDWKSLIRITSLKLSSQIYRLLISASSTLMETQARSFEFFSNHCIHSTREVKLKSHQLLIHFFLKSSEIIWDKSGESV